MLPGPITFRTAVPSDSSPIAELHAASWRASYRGRLSDSYLDGTIFAERGAFWRDRLGTPADRRYVLLAEAGEALVGFVCVMLDAEPVWGAYLDNLHVRPGLTGRGVGSSLFAEAARWVIRVEPTWAIHLFVFEGNVGARRFYERHGGEQVERVMRVMPDGGTSAVYRYLWRDPSRLLATPPAEA